MKILAEPLDIRIKRALWLRGLSPLYRVWIKTLYGVQLEGKSFWIGPAIFRNRGTISIKSGARVASASWANPLGIYRASTFGTAEGASILIGSNFGASGCCIVAAQKVEIGNNVSLGANVTILDTDLHAIRPNQFGARGGMAEAKSRPVTIGHNVWIGSGVIILKGVSIGDNCVIGAGLTVRESLPALHSLVGTPALSKNLKPDA